MAINTGKVVVGGLTAGLVGNVVGYLLFGLWLGPTFKSEMNAVASGLGDKGETTSAMVCTILAGFVVGLVLAWLYAAIRPRFGPGLKTAMYAGIAVWILGFVFHIDLWILGLTMPATYIMASAAALVQTLASAWVAGMMYKEEAAPA